MLTKALQTPEHAGRVRGVGSLVTSTVFFNIPNGKRCRITKAELLARDRERDAEYEKSKQEMAAELVRTRQEMAELKAMLGSNNPSPSLFFNLSMAYFFSCFSKLVLFYIQSRVKCNTCLIR